MASLRKGVILSLEGVRPVEIQGQFQQLEKEALGGVAGSDWRIFVPTNKLLF